MKGSLPAGSLQSVSHHEELQLLSKGKSVEDASVCAVPALCCGKLILPFVNLAVEQDNAFKMENARSRGLPTGKGQLA